MKKNIQTLVYQLLLSIGCGLLATRAIAQDLQDVIYFETGEVALNVRLKEVTNDKIIVQGNNKPTPFTRSKIVLAFSKEGNFLVIAELSADLQQAKQQLQAFLMAPPRKDGNDYLIKATPLSVIPARISYESEKIVNYKTPEGNAASISKNDLVAILYRDGRHLLIKPANEVAPLLAEIRPDIEQGGKPAAPPTLTTPPQSTSATAVATDSSASVPQNQSAEPSSKRVLTESEKELYRQKSFERVDDFLNYINIITDKSISSDDKDKAIEQALRLFTPGAKIEVTSARRQGVRSLPVEQYLYQLKVLPYSSTKVEWYDSHFVSDLALTADGTYEGTITGEQRFTGYGSGGQTSYSDVTQKNVRVKLKAYQKIIDGDPKIRWQALLGNVSVSSDK